MTREGGRGGDCRPPAPPPAADAVLRAFPGAVAVSRVTDADLARLDAGHDRRGLGARQHPRRALSEELQLQALCEWLHGHGLDLMGVVTFSDDYADRHGIYSLKRAVQDVWDGLTSMPQHNGKVGYPYKFVLAGELHRTGRSVPHVHVALESHGAPPDKLCAELFIHFLLSRGRCRFEPMRDVTVATLYGLKDTVKASKSNPDALAARLWYPKRRSRSGGVSPERLAEHGPQPAVLSSAGMRGPDEPF